MSSVQFRTPRHTDIEWAKVDPQTQTKVQKRKDQLEGSRCGIKIGLFWTVSMVAVTVILSSWEMSFPNRDPAMILGINCSIGGLASLAGVGIAIHSAVDLRKAKKEALEDEIPRDRIQSGEYEKRKSDIDAERATKEKEHKEEMKKLDDKLNELNRVIGKQ